MAIFGRKKDDEEDYEEELSFAEASEGRENRKFSRKVRDLSPKNKKKRKEPTKPWGKKERLLVFSILFITTLTSGLFAFFARENKLPNLPRFVINPFGEATIEIGQQGHFDSNDQKAKEAISLFNKEIKPISGLYGFYVVRLSDGSSYGVSDNEKFQGASLLKLPLLALLYKESDEGKVNLASKYILKNSDKVAGSGTLDKDPAGTVYTLRQLAEFMAKDSDRTAYKIIKNILGDTAFNNFLLSIGMKNTDIATGETTPGDAGKILEDLYLGKIVNEKSREEIFSLLTNTIYENWITKGVPHGIRVVHKYGADAGVMADGGIVFAQNPYILVIMSNGITASDADKIFPAISKDIYGIESDIR